jgi:hypothetical protein
VGSGSYVNIALSFIFQLRDVRLLLVANAVKALQCFGLRFGKPADSTAEGRLVLGNTFKSSSGLGKLCPF